MLERVKKMFHYESKREVVLHLLKAQRLEYENVCKREQHVMAAYQDLFQGFVQETKKLESRIATLEALQPKPEH